MVFNPLGIMPLQTAGLQTVANPPLLLVTMMPDDSGSIASYGNTAAIRRGHNAQLEASKGHPSMLLRTRYLNGFELFGFRKPEDAVAMNESNYTPNQGTPLFDQTFALLDEVMRASASYVDRFDVYTMTCILTDGADTGSAHPPADVKAVVDRMLASGRHVVAGIGVRDGSTDFPKVFKSMGIPEQWIKVLERNEGDIVEGMTQFSRATRTVVSGATFKHATMTGFVQPPPVSVTNSVPQQAATAMPGAGTIGVMMGAAMKRAPEEMGQVPAAQLPWEPRPYGYEMDNKTGNWKQAASPIALNTANGFYELPLPPEGTVYLIGRDHPDTNAETQAKYQAFVDAARRKNPNVRILFITLKDRRAKSPLSRYHAVVENIGGAATVRPMGADIAVLVSNNPADDEYRQAKSDGPSFIDQGQRLRLAPGVILRMK